MEKHPKEKSKKKPNPSPPRIKKNSSLFQKKYFFTFFLKNEGMMDLSKSWKR